jgi:hypothetical protein
MVDAARAGYHPMTSATKYVKRVYPRTKRNKPVPASSELASDYHYAAAQNRLTETIHKAVGQSEPERKDQEIIAPHKGSLEPFDPIEESLYWLIFAAAVAVILFYVFTV